MSKGGHVVCHSVPWRHGELSAVRGQEGKVGATTVLMTALCSTAMSNNNTTRQNCAAMDPIACSELLHPVLYWA